MYAMKKYALRTWSLAALGVLAAASGCKKDDSGIDPVVATQTPMSITTSIAQEPKPQAAASKAAMRDGAFANGEQVGLYVVAWRKPTVAGLLENKYNYVDNAKATYSSTTTSWSIAPTIFYPTVAVDIYGYAPYKSGFAPTDTPSAYEFTVVADQSSNIRDNDLLTALNVGVASTDTPLEMTFYHRLSRVEAKFKVPASFKGKTISSVQSVVFKNFLPTAVVDLTTAYTYTIDGAATGGAYPKPATAKAGALRVDITPSVVQTSTPGSTATDGTEYFVYEAVVPPQSLIANTGFVEIVVKYQDATTETFFYVTSGTSTFPAAKSTVLNLAFQADYTILLGTVDITRWVSVTETQGSVVEREVFNRFTITLPAVSGTQVGFVNLTTKAGTAAEKVYLLPAVHTAGTATVTCAFDGTQDSPEFYAFDITKVEWLDANKNSLGNKTLTTAQHLTATGSVAIIL